MSSTHFLPPHLRRRCVHVVCVVREWERCIMFEEARFGWLVMQVWRVSDRGPGAGTVLRSIATHTPLDISGRAAPEEGAAAPPDPQTAAQPEDPGQVAGVPIEEAAPSQAGAPEAGGPEGQALKKQRKSRGPGGDTASEASSSGRGAAKSRPKAAKAPGGLQRTLGFLNQ